MESHMSSDERFHNEMDTSLSSASLEPLPSTSTDLRAATKCEGQLLSTNKGSQEEKFCKSCDDDVVILASIFIGIYSDL